MRKINDHKVNGLNEAIEITAGEPGPGGASTYYEIYVPDSVPPTPGTTIHVGLSFQSQPIASPADYNGITNEALLAIIIDRMRGFQGGPFASRDGAIALTHLEDALLRLQRRTRERMARGVEGKLEK